MSKTLAGDPWPYLLVEESLKKCQSSERFREFLAQKLSQRADIEMQYIKKLQDWMDNLILPAVDFGSVDAYLGCDVIKKILDCIRQDTQLTTASRQQLYNNLMSDNGPYLNLYEMATDENQKTAKETDIHFRQLYKMRNDIDKAYRHHVEMYEHLKHEIEALEDQISRTNSVASARRSASRNGTRKIDIMRERVSELRQRYRVEEVNVEKSEAELKHTELAAQQMLSDMEKVLREIEMTRIQQIIEEVKTFVEHVQKNQTPRSTANKSKAILGNLESAQKLIKCHWLDVRSRTKKGDTTRIQNMFEGSSARGKPNFVSAKSVFSQVMADSQNTESQACDKTDSILTYFNSRKSGSESSVEADNEGTSAMAFVGAMETRRVSKKKSQESIESLVLPPEVKCKAEISKLEPNKQYLTRMKLAKNAQPSPRAHMTEYSNVNQFHTSAMESDDDDDDDDDDRCLGKLHNVRVVAIEDCDHEPDSEFLSFKRGQIIKQKIGENENGYCYGWTRENRIGKKQYGIYKTSMVRLFKKHTNL